MHLLTYSAYCNYLLAIPHIGVVTKYLLDNNYFLFFAKRRYNLFSINPIPPSHCAKPRGGSYSTATKTNLIDLTEKYFILDLLLPPCCCISSKIHHCNTTMRYQRFWRFRFANIPDLICIADPNTNTNNRKYSKFYPFFRIKNILPFFYQNHYH